MFMKISGRDQLASLVAGLQVVIIKNLQRFVVCGTISNKYGLLFTALKTFCMTACLFQPSCIRRECSVPWKHVTRSTHRLYTSDSTKNTAVIWFGTMKDKPNGSLVDHQFED